MFIRLISSEGDKEENFSVPTRNQTSDLGVQAPIPYPLSHKESTVTHAKTRSICDTCSAYSYDKECQNALCVNRIRQRQENERYLSLILLSLEFIISLI